MTTASIAIGRTEIVVTVDPGNVDQGTDGSAIMHVIPRGAQTLTDLHIVDDPPLPEQLTNAIADVLDHLDDARREQPALADAETIEISGSGPRAIAAVEVGGAPPGDRFVLSREAAEDVFRTLVTEARADRMRNPGLPADLADEIVGACCAVVAVFRSLHLDEAVIDLREDGTGHDTRRDTGSNGTVDGTTDGTTEAA